MAYKNFKVLDSDIHIIEPPDLWPRYIDPAFRDQAPSGVTEFAGDLRLGNRLRQHLGCFWRKSHPSRAGRADRVPQLLGGDILL